VPPVSPPGATREERPCRFGPITKRIALDDVEAIVLTSPTRREGWYAILAREDDEGAAPLTFPAAADDDGLGNGLACPDESPITSCLPVRTSGGAVLGSVLDQKLTQNPTLAAYVNSDPKFRAYLEAALNADPQLLAADRALAKDWQNRLGQHRDWLVQTEYEVSTSYDKTLVTLATGALALSVVLLKALEAAPSYNALFWLRLGWASLVASVVVLLASVATGRISLRYAISFTDQMILHPPSLIRSTPAGRKPTPTRWTGWLTDALTTIASILFTVGIASLIYFVAITVPPKEVPPDDSGAAETQRSDSPPLPPPAPAVFPESQPQQSPGASPGPGDLGYSPPPPAPAGEVQPSAVDSPSGDPPQQPPPEVPDQR